MVQGSLGPEANVLPDGFLLDFFEPAYVADQQDTAPKEVSFRKGNRERHCILWGS